MSLMQGNALSERFKKLLQETEELERKLRELKRRKAGKLSLYAEFELLLLDMTLTLSVALPDIKEQVNRGFQRRNQQKIVEVFEKNRAGSLFATKSAEKRDEMGRFQILRPFSAGAWLIPKVQLLDALHDLDVDIKGENIDQVFYTMDMDDNQGLDLEEFKKALQVLGIK